MYRPLKIQFRKDFPHWMKNLNPWCKEAKGIHVTIKSDNIGVYNEEKDVYIFKPTLAKESHGCRAGSDPSKPEYYKYIYAESNEWIPIVNADLALILKPIVIEDVPQTKLF